MGLLPLEFSDCLLDSPYFRENLRAHEKQLDATSSHIKTMVKDVADVIEASRGLSKAKKTLAATLDNFQFDCLGTTLTDDEVIIANSLKEFSKFLLQVDAEMDRMLDRAADKFMSPLEAFRKDQIGSVKKTRKEFEKATARFCAAQDRYATAGSTSAEAAAETARAERRALDAASLQYVHLLHVVQERKKFEFVEALLSLTHSWTNYYRHGAAVAEDFDPFMEDLRARVQRTRESFAATVEQFDRLKERTLRGGHDPGSFNKMYARQGYLYMKRTQSKLPGGRSQWTKCYCQYRASDRTLTLIPYSQVSPGKINLAETVKVSEVACKEEGTGEKFRFIVSGEEHQEDESAPSVPVSHTFQAVSDFERKQWVKAMGGTWPAVSTLQRMKADSVEENLNSVAFTFLKDCLAELEARGLNDKGLYRVGGVLSKTKSLLSQGLETGKSLDLSDVRMWESKTIASAVKQYFRDLSKPLLTHALYPEFLEAAKRESDAERLAQITAAVNRLPPASKEMAAVLVRHLARVAANSSVNLMTAGNLAVCFGPTLLRPREETVASIMDIKFCNQVLEIMIEHSEELFQSNASHAPSSAESSPAQPKRPSVDSEVLLQNSNSEYGAEDNCSREPTPKRTHSFGSFNSLPDIERRLRRTSPSATAAATAAAAVTKVSHDSIDGGSSGRPRSKSQQHDSVADSSVKKQSSLPPTNELAKSQNDHLMASLEMMNLLAADLPNSSSKLKRSVTLQINKLHSSSDASSKPPLPKLSLSHTSQDVPCASPLFAYHHHVNSSPSPSLSSESATSSSSPRTPRSSSDLLVRLQQQQQQQQQLLDKQQQPPAVPVRRYRRLVISPASLQEHSAKVTPDLSAATFRPLITTTLPKPMNLSSDSGLTTLTSSLPPSERGSRLRPASPTSRGGNGSNHRNLAEEDNRDDDAVDDDDDDDDNCSLSSSAFSAVSNQYGENSRESRYENVSGRHRSHHSGDEDGDDEAEASEDGDCVDDCVGVSVGGCGGSSSVNSSLVDEDESNHHLRRSSSNVTEAPSTILVRGMDGGSVGGHHRYFRVPDLVPRTPPTSHRTAAVVACSAFPPVEGPAAQARQQQPDERRRKNRDSGPYDNVPQPNESSSNVRNDDLAIVATNDLSSDDDDQDVDRRNSEKRPQSIREGSADNTFNGASAGVEEEVVDEDDQEHNDFRDLLGMNSIRNILAVGQTSDV